MSLLQRTKISQLFLKTAVFALIIGFNSINSVLAMPTPPPPDCATLPIVNVPVVGDPNNGPCGPGVTHYIVDLSSNADTTWVSPSDIRFRDTDEPCNTCCSANVLPPENERCVSFELTLHPDAVGIRFFIASGASPGGSLGWREMFPGSGTCGVEHPGDMDVCMDGPGPHFISFCKPGNNPNSYGITSFETPGAGPTDIVSDACDGTIWGTGYDESTITWNSVSPGAPGVHNGYLSETSNEDTVTVNFVDGAPDSVFYEICGQALGVDAATCPASFVCDTTSVEFVQTLQVDINPKDPVICFGSTVGVTLSALDSGGKAPTLYDWSPINDITQDVQAMTSGWYYVTVRDNSGCPTASDSVFVRAITDSVIADAGDDLISCVNNPNIQIFGDTTTAQSVYWEVLSGASGTGDGTFDNDSIINPTYSPGSNDLANPGIPIQIRLIAINEPTCPGDTDIVLLTIEPAPTVDAGTGSEICATGSCASLVATSSTGSGSWSGGGGTFNSPNSLASNYCPSAPEIAAAPLDITLYFETTNNSSCLPVRDSVIISLVPSPVIDAGTGGSVCANNSDFTTNGTVTNPDGGVGTGTWTTNGDGNFNGTENNLAATYSPGSTDISLGNVILTLTSTSNTSGGGATCNAVTDTIHLNITSAPTINVGDDEQVCQNNDLVEDLTAVTTVATGVNWSAPDGVFSAPGNNITDFNPNAGLAPLPYDIEVIATTTGSGNCLEVSDTLNITITPSPSIDFEIPTRVCQNDPEICVTNMNLQNASGVLWLTGAGGTSFNNSNTDLEPCYTPNATELGAQGVGGNVILFAQTTGVGNCTPITKDTVIIIFPSPQVSIALDTVCENNPIVNLDGTVIGGGTTTWTTDGSGSFGGTENLIDATYDATNDVPNPVTLTLTSILNIPNFVTCNPVSADFTLTYTPSPTVYAGPNQSLCSNNPIVTTNGSVTLATGGTWLTLGDGSFNGTENNLVATYTPGSQDLVDTNVYLVLETTGNGECNPVRDTMQVIFTPAPIVDAGLPQDICSNNLCNIDLVGTVTVETGGTWSTVGGGSFSPNITNLNTAYCADDADTLLSPLDIILTSTNNTNCNPVSDTTQITFTPSPIVVGTGDTVCANNSLATVSAFINAEATGVTWSGGGGTIASPNNLITTYQPTLGERNGGIATLYAQTIGVGNCNIVRDTVVIVITPAPTVNAGSPQTVCANNPVVTLNGSVTNATGGQWISLSGNNAGFADQNVLNTTYTPNNADTAAGSVCLVLTTTGVGNCAIISDTMCITITPAPIAEAGNPQSVCQNNASITLDGSVSVATGGNWTSSVAGIFTPNSSNLGASFNPTNPTVGNITFTLATIGSGNCIEVSDQVIVTVTPAPTVFAGNDVDVCADAPAINLNGSVTIATGGIWNATGNTFGSGNNTTLTDIYIPTPGEISAGSGSIVLITNGNGNCSPVADTMNFTIAPAPIVEAGPTQVVCGNVANVNLNGSVLNAGGGTWTSSSGNNAGFGNQNNVITTYSPNGTDLTNGTVLLTLTSTGNGDCGPVTDTVRLNFESAPTVDAGDDETICSNEYPIQLQGSGTQGTWSGGLGNFLPSANVLNATYQPDPSETGTTIELILTTDNIGACPQISDTVEFELLEGPTVFAGNDITVCGDVNSVTLNGSFGGTSTGLQWTRLAPATGTFGSLTNPNTDYNITAQDRNIGLVKIVAFTTGTLSCPIVSDTLDLIITPAPTVDAGFPQTVCADAGSVNLDGTITVAGGGLWSSPTGNSFVDDTIIDGVYNIKPIDTTNGTVTLTLCSTENGTCAQVCDDVTITITPAPTIFAGNDATICADSTAYQLDGSFTVATGIIWTAIDGDGSFSPSNVDPNAFYYPSNQDTTDGIVTLVISTGNSVGTCIPITDTVILTITPTPTIFAGNDATICADQPTIDVSGVINPSAGGVNWSTTSIDGTFNNNSILNPTYTLGTSDSVFVTLTATTTGSGMCNEVSDQMNITVTPRVGVYAGPDGTFCADANSINLNGVVTVATGGRWDLLSGTGTIDAPTSLSTFYVPSPADTLAGCVTLTLTSTGNGLCQEVIDTVEICFNPVPVPNAGLDATICADSASYQLNGTVSNAGGGAWSTSGTGSFFSSNTILAPSYEPSTADTLAGQVTLYITTTGNGICSPVVDSMILTITPAPTIFVGDDQTVCADNDTIDLTSFLSIATNVDWSTSGSGSFTNNPGVSTQYLVHENDDLSGTINITGTTTGNGMCKAVSDQMTLTITDRPTVDAGNDQDLCGDQSTLTLNGVVTVATGGIWSTPNGDGTFSNSTALIGSVYNIDQQDSIDGTLDIILTTTGNGTCNPVSDTITINLQPGVFVDGGNDITVCADTASIQLTSTYETATGIEWLTSGSGTFSVNQFDSTAIYIISNDDKINGGATITVTTTGNGICPAATEDILLTITPAPVLNPGIDQTVCADNPTINLNGSVTVTGTGQWSTGNGQGTFSVDNTDLSGTFTPSQNQINAGTVIVTLTSTNNGTCNSVDSNFTLTINPIILVDAGDNVGVCANTGSIALNGVVTNAGGGIWTTTGSGTFANDTVLNTTYSYSQSDSIAGFVTLILTSTGNGLCNPISDSINLTIQPLPSISASPDTVCGDIAFNIPLSATYNGAGGMQWSTAVGQGSFIPNVVDSNVQYDPQGPGDLNNSPFLIYATTTGNGVCPAAVDSAIISIRQTPVVNAGNDILVCANNAAITLNGTYTNSLSVRWSSSGGGVFSAPTDNTPNTATTDYTISSTDIALGLSGGSTIYLTTTNNGLCPAVVDSLNLIVTPAPTVDAGPRDTICADHDTVNLSALVNVATGVTWSLTGAADGTFTNPNSSNTEYLLGTNDSSSAPTTIVLQVETTGNGNCIPVTDTKTILVTPAPTLSVISDLTFCEDFDRVAFTASYTVAVAGDWTSNSDGSFDPNTTQNNIYYDLGPSDTAVGSFTVYFKTDKINGCYSYIDSAVANITEAPTVDAGNANVCASVDTVNLNGTFTIAGGIEWTTLNGTGYFIDSSDVNTGYIPSAADKINPDPLYIVIETVDGGDCDVRYDTILLSISPPIEVSAGVDDTVCADTSGYILDGSFAISDSAQWSTLGDGTFVNQFDTNTTYIPGSADIDSGYVQLVLQTVGNGFCDAEFDTLNLVITPFPTINITATSTCTDRDTLYIGSNYTVATGINWSTDGDGTFIPGGTPSPTSTSTLDDPDYELGATDKLNGTFNIFVETTGNGLCKTYYDTLEVELTPAPTSEAGSDTSICADADSLEVNGGIFVDGGGGGVWSTSGQGTFDDSTSLNTVYYFDDNDTIGGSVTLYLTTTGGTCSPVTDSLVVTYTTTPTVTAGGGTVCIDNGIIPLNGAFTISGGITWSPILGSDGNFDDDENPITNYNVGPNDVIADSALIQICTRLNGSCKTYCDTIQVNLDPGPVATAQVDTFCADLDTIFLVGNSTTSAGTGLWTTLGDGVFTLNQLDTSRYILGESDIDTGFVDIILETTNNEDCDADFDTVRIIIDSIPVVATANDFTVCGDTAFIPLNGSVAIAGGGLWSTIDGTPANIAVPTDLSTTYLPTSADTLRGSVTFVLESTDNDLCNIVRDTLVVNILPIPIVNIEDTLICADVLAVPFSATFSYANGVTWSTSNGGGSFVPVSSSNTNYLQAAPDGVGSIVNIIVTTTGNGMCKQQSDSTTLIITDPPTVEAGPSMGVCNDQDTICLMGGYTIDDLATWNFVGGSGNLSPNNTDTSSCYVLGPTDTAGTVIEFFYTTNGSSGCIPVIDSVTISISDGPTVDAGLPDTICADANQLNLNGTYTISGGAEWSSLTGGTFSPTVSDTIAMYKISQLDSTNGFVNIYLTTTFNGSCLPVTDSVRMIINPTPTVDAGQDHTICADSSGVEITGIVNVALGGAWTSSGSGSFNPDTFSLVTTYEPSNSDINDSIIVLTLTTTGNDLCNPVSDNMNIFITPRPTVFAGFPQEVCADADSVILSGSVTIATGGQWTSLGGAGTGTFVNSTDLNTSFILSADDITAGFVDLVLTTIGSGNCIEISDTVRITITDAVTLTSNNDTTVCTDLDDIVLISSYTVASGVIWSTLGDGDIEPSNVNDTITYEFSTNDTTQPSVTLIVQTTGNGTCLAQTDSIVITFDPLPIANAGIDFTTCADNPVVSLTGSVANAPGGTWTTSGDGFFTLDTDLLTDYNLDGDDELNGLVDVFLTTDLVGSCNPDVDVMQITINPAPTVEAGSNQEWCEDVNGIQLSGSFTTAGGVEWTSSGTGTFIDINDPNTMYTRSADDITNGSVTLTLCTILNDLCQPVCDSMIYTITPGPTVDAGPNDTVCADAGSVILSGASFDGMATSNLLWTTTSLGIFSNATSLSPIWTPDPSIIPIGNDAPLVVTFNLENQQSGSCNPVNDQKVVVFNPIPTIDLGNDDTVCVDIDTIYLISNVLNAQSVSWSSSGSGSFPNGNTGFNVEYIPSTNDRTLNSLLFTATTVGTDLCLDYTDQVLIIFRERPTIDAGVDQRVCSNSNGIILDGLITLANGGTWNTINGSGSFVDNNDLGTTYILGLNDTLNNGPVLLELTTAPYSDCKQYKDTVLIDFDSQPTVSAGDASFCAEESGFPVNGSFSNAGGVLWSTSGDGTFFSPSDLSPVYTPGANDRANDFARLYITAITGNTCPDITDSIDVTIIPLPIADAGFDVTVCRGGSTDLIAVINPGTDYQWYSIDGTPIDMMNPIITVTANNDTSFVLEATDQIYSNCSIFDTVNVNVFDPPSLNLPDHYCLSDTILLDAAPLPDTLPTSYQWYERVPPNLIDFGTPTTTVDVSGSYIFAFIYDQCQVYDTTEVTDPPVVEHEDKIVCIGQTIDIEATSLTGVIYNWTEEATGNSVATNSNPVSVTADSDTINDQLFIVEVIDALGCISFDTVALTKLPPPIMTLENQPLCIGDEITLNATPINVIDSLLSGAEFNWFVDGDSISGEHDSTLEVLVAGDYIVEFGIGECKALDSSRVDFNPLPVPDMQQKYEFCFDYETELIINGGPAFAYLWDESNLSSNELTDSVLTVFGYGDFPITIYNEYNCEARDTIEIVEICEPRVFPPTGFIPNGQPCDLDCIDNDCNNCFFIKGSHYKNWNLRVYNRWGEVIFHSTNPDATDGSGMWDGSYKGEPMPAGVYPWVLYYEGDTPNFFGPYQLEGKITIIR